MLLSSEEKKGPQGGNSLPGGNLRVSKLAGAGDSHMSYIFDTTITDTHTCTATHSGEVIENVRFAKYVTLLLDPFFGQQLPVELKWVQNPYIYSPTPNLLSHTHTHTHTANGSYFCCWHSKLCPHFLTFWRENALKFVARRINVSTVCVLP